MPYLLQAALLASIVSPAPAIASACTGALHIAVEKDAVYTLDHASVVSAQPGLADCAADELQLTQRGKPVPLRIVDGGDGRFGAGDRVEWIGARLHGPESWFDAYSTVNAYVLSAAPGPHARMRDMIATDGRGRASLGRVAHFERDDLMIRLDQTQQEPGDEPDVWQWSKLTHADPKPFTTEFDLADLDDRGRETRVTLNFRGMSRIFTPATHQESPHAHHVVEVALNGRALKPLSWNGRDEMKFEFRVPSSLLKEMGNTLTLAVPKRPLPWKPAEATVDVVMFNWIEFDFPVTGRLDASGLPLTASSSDPIDLDSTSPVSPVLYGEDGVRRPGTPLGNGRYRFAPSSPGTVLHPVREDELLNPTGVRALAEDRWHEPATGFDYLIVSHASLIDSIRPLADFHEQRGLKVAVIDVQDVYDTFNDGITHPQAIRNLVEHAHHRWPAPRPRFLLLVGDASFDIRHDTYNDLAYAKFANNPTELAYPGHFAGIQATQYDATSKRMAGRNLIPTWQFPSPEGQSASDNAFGIVDRKGFHPAVAVGRFPVVEPGEVKAIVDKTIGYMTRPQPGSWQRDVMFITDESDYFKKSSDQIAQTIAQEGFVADKIYASSDEADNLAHQSAIRDGLNSGQLLVHFIGHGGRYIWRTGPPDIRKNHDLFTLDDVSALTNAGRLPMILSMTCYSAPFDNPTEDSIGERFLREADKGAVAVFAASWRNAPSTEFSKALVTEMLTPGATIGEGIVRAKGAIQDRVLVEMYNLLGDPAVILKRPRVNATLVLDEDRWNPGVYVALPQGAFDGEVFVDWLDASGNPAQRAHFALVGNRFRLSVPRMTEEPIVGVRVIASSRLGGQDAAAQLDFPRPFAAAPSSDAPAARATDPAAAPSAAPRAERPMLAPGDAISHAEFEADEVPPLTAFN